MVRAEFEEANRGRLHNCSPRENREDSDAELEDWKVIKDLVDIYDIFPLSLGYSTELRKTS